MVAVLFAQGCGIVAAALFDLYDLGRTGFTAHCVSKSATDTVCRTARFQYLLHCAFDVFEVIGFKRNLTLGIRIDTGNFARTEIQYFFDQMRLMDNTVVGQRGCRMCHLQRRVGIVALADTDGNHLAGAPFFGSRVGRFGKAFGFPFAAGQNACVFAGQVNTGFLAETELRQIRRGFVDTHFVTQAVEEGI